MSAVAWFPLVCHVVSSAPPRQWLARDRHWIHIHWIEVCADEWTHERMREHKEDPGDGAELLSFFSRIPTACLLPLTGPNRCLEFLQLWPLWCLGRSPRYSWSPDGRILLNSDCLSQYMRLQNCEAPFQRGKLPYTVQHSCFSRNQNRDLCELICKSWMALILWWAPSSFPTSAWPVFWLRLQPFSLELLVNSSPEGLVGERRSLGVDLGKVSIHPLRWTQALELTSLHGSRGPQLQALLGICQFVLLQVVQSLCADLCSPSRAAGLRPQEIRNPSSTSIAVSVQPGNQTTLGVLFYSVLFLFLLLFYFFERRGILNRGTRMQQIGYNGERRAEKPTWVYPPSCPPVSSSAASVQKPCDTETSSNHPLVILSKVGESAWSGFEGRQSEDRPRKAPDASLYF